MKTSRFKFGYRDNASKLHIAVGEILRGNALFANQSIYQEYPVNKVNPFYPDGTHHFDWVIPDLKLVFECHGKQHYEPVRFGGISIEEANQAYAELKKRDFTKRDAALAAGFKYIEIPYSLAKKLNHSKLLELIYEAEVTLQEYEHQVQSLVDDELDNSHLVERKRRKDVEKLKSHRDEALATKHQKIKNQREEYKNSKKYQDKLQEARSYRQARYRRLKEKQNES